MKSFLFSILAMLVIACSAQPCCVDKDCEGEIESAHQGEHKDKGACSPFFACNSCTGFVPGERQVTPPQIATAVLQHVAAIPSFILSSYSPTVFQPPRPV